MEEIDQWHNPTVFLARVDDNPQYRANLIEQQIRPKVDEFEKEYLDHQYPFY